MIRPATAGRRAIKKGSTSTLDYKGSARRDEDGLLDKIHTIAASQAESPKFDTTIDGASAERVLSDKAEASKVNRVSLRAKHGDGVLTQAARPK